MWQYKTNKLYNFKFIFTLLWSQTFTMQLLNFYESHFSIFINYFFYFLNNFYYNFY